jgi:hypothetical protein
MNKVPSKSYYTQDYDQVIKLSEDGPNDIPIFTQLKADEGQKYRPDK